MEAAKTIRTNGAAGRSKKNSREKGIEAEKRKTWIPTKNCQTVCRLSTKKVIIEKNCCIQPKACTTVSSEVIDDPDEPSTSSSSADADAEWLPCKSKRRKMPEFITPKLPQREWMKPAFAAADRGKVSHETLFNIFRDMLVGNGVDMKDVVMSPSVIRQMRGEEQIRIADHIKVHLSVKIG